jgi:hypothetical protein
MSKRQERKPNIPQETLDRARRQVSGEQSSGTPAAGEPAQPKPIVTRTRTTAERREARSERRASSSAGGSPRRPAAEPMQFSQRRKKEALTPEEIEDLLHNPTKTVSEEQLRAEYGHVVADVRSMGMLAAVLMVLLVVLAQFI